MENTSKKRLSGLDKAIIFFVILEVALIGLFGYHYYTFIRVN